MHLSPINVSVHTTNGELRKKMLNNRFAGDILEKLEFLAKNRKIHLLFLKLKVYFHRIKTSIFENVRKESGCFHKIKEV